MQNQHLGTGHLTYRISSCWVTGHFTCRISTCWVAGHFTCRISTWRVPTLFFTPLPPLVPGGSLWRTSGFRMRHWNPRWNQMFVSYMWNQNWQSLVLTRYLQVPSEHWIFPHFSTHFHFKIRRRLHTFFGRINNLGIAASWTIILCHTSRLTWRVNSVTMDVVFPRSIKSNSTGVLSFQTQQI